METGSMKWIELKRSSSVQIHEPLILIQSNPANDPEAESSPVQSGHNRVGIYQIPSNTLKDTITFETIRCPLSSQPAARRNRLAPWDVMGRVYVLRWV